MEIEIKEIDSSFFDSKNQSLLKDNTATIVLFYKPECKYCREFIPTYNKISKQLLFIKLRAVDVTKNQSLFNNILKEKPNFILTFPTLIFYDNCEPIFKYDDERTKEKIIQSILQNYKESKNLIIYK